MANLKFSELPTSSDFSDIDLFVGIKNTGAGETGFTNYKYTAQSLIDYVRSELRAVIISDSNGDQLTAEFFTGKTIIMLFTDGQTYLEGDNFTQNGNTINGVNITFYAGQKLIAFT